MKRMLESAYFRKVTLGFSCVMLWIIIEGVFDIRIRFHEVFQETHQSSIDPLIVYEPCTKIPKAPNGTIWPEEAFIYDTDPTSILELADPFKSRAWIEGESVAKVGDIIKVRIVLYDGYGLRKKTGGDLIRVWMKERSLNASSAAHVTDNKDGSYSAILTAFWEGRPEVVVAIISPREVIATAFKRRYLCPPVLMNSAIFAHPVDTSIIEETPCNYVNQVPGYQELCNFTQENYGRPWYCGKPRSLDNIVLRVGVQKVEKVFKSWNFWKVFRATEEEMVNIFNITTFAQRHGRLMCHDWTMVADVNLWKTGNETQNLSNMAYQLMTLNFTARKLDSNLILTVHKDNTNQSVFVPSVKCENISYETSWEITSPTGYFYENIWTDKKCRTTFRSSRTIFNSTKVESCLRNTNVLLIGDSTLRQMFSEIEKMMPCNWTTDTWSASGKHRPTNCQNRNQNFSLTWELHPLPFCTRNTPRHYFKSFSAYLNELQGNIKTIVVLHMYAHVLNHHSSVFYETLKDIKQGVVGLLNRNKNAHVIIKGPNAYSFSKSNDHVIWMPDAYSSIYQAFIYNEFKDMNDRVIYLETLDMTVSTEQWHIHVEDYIVRTYFEQILNRVCSL